MEAAATVVEEIPTGFDGGPSDVLRLGRGWHYLGRGDSGSYRWTEPEFEIHVDEAAECLAVEYTRPGDFGAADCLIIGPDGWVERAVHPLRTKLVIDLKRIAAGPRTLCLSLSKTGRAAAMRLNSDSACIGANCSAVLRLTAPGAMVPMSNCRRWFGIRALVRLAWLFVRLPRCKAGFAGKAHSCEQCISRPAGMSGRGYRPPLVRHHLEVVH
jgi:hypothetical protein